LVIIQKYRFIADLLTAWEANGSTLGVDQQLKIRELLRKIPEDAPLSDFKTLLTPIFARDAKQQEAFYALFNTLIAQEDIKNIINEKTDAPPLTTPDNPNPTPPSPPSLFRLKNKGLWWSMGVIVIILALMLIFFDSISSIFKPKPKPEHYVREALMYDTTKANVYPFRFDATTPSVKTIGLVSNTSKLQNIGIDIKNINNSIPFVKSMPKGVAQSVDTIKLLFTYQNRAKEYVYYIFTVTNQAAATTATDSVTLNLKPYKHTRDTSDLRAKQTLQFYPLDGAWSWTKMGIWLLMGGAIWGISYWRRRKEQRELAARRDNKTKPPYAWKIKIDGIENALQLNDIFFRTANDMRRRSEMDVQRLDMPRTIQATIRRAGMPQFRFRQPTQANEYLVLIDQNAAQSHRAKLFGYLLHRWQQSEVLAERFFFNGDIRLCWNEKNPRGLSIADLRQRFPAHRLIVVGHGFWLLKTMVVEWDEWTAGLLDGWRQKVLLTPRMPQEWDARERVLAEKFRILPAILRGLGELSETLNAVETPNYKRWQDLNTAETDPIRVPRKLSAETLMIFLEAHFTLRTKDGKRDDSLLQWIAACAVPPLIHWDVTMAFGQVIQANSATNDGLLTLDNMFKLTRLPWFNEATMPDEARRVLLDWLAQTHPSVLAQVRTRWAEILTINKPPTDSVAFDDYSLTLTINALYQKPTPRQKAKLNQELERSLANEPRQDFLVLDYLAAQRTPLEGFVPKRFSDYLRDPERRIPTLKAWVWQVPLWLLGAFLLFSIDYANDCKRGVGLSKTTVACIKSEQDELLLMEYAMCDVLDKNYWNYAAFNADSVVAGNYFRKTGPSVNPAIRVDEDLLALAQKRIRDYKLDSTSFYRNLKIGYANAAIRYINKNFKDSACIYSKLYANLQTGDSVLTAEEKRYFNQICNSNSKDIPVVAPIAANKIAPPNRNAAQQKATQSPIIYPNKDTAQQQKTTLADVLSVTISGIQKDTVSQGETLNINYAVSNDGEKPIIKLQLFFWINETILSEKDIDISVGETVRGVETVTIPRGLKSGTQTLLINAQYTAQSTTQYKGQTVKSDARKIEINPTKGTIKK
jgi:hypothetical protein